VHSRTNKNLISVTQWRFYSFFCYMSKRKSEGYQRKLAWVKQRLAEGMRIKIIRRGGRGIIEYIPGEYAWRAVNKAKGYMMIHCLWIVGKKNQRQGHGGYLLDQCIQDARRAGMRGVAMVTSSGVWLADEGILLKHGFEVVDQVPPHFSLLVKRFDSSAPLARPPTSFSPARHTLIAFSLPQNVIPPAQSVRYNRCERRPDNKGQLHSGCRHHCVSAPL